jgi:hypothetical protein
LPLVSPLGTEGVKHVAKHMLSILTDEQLKQIVEMVKPALQVTDDEITEVGQEE